MLPVAWSVLPFLLNFYCIQTLSVNSEQVTQVNLTVFYQSRCPDSAKFFDEQLRPTYQEWTNSGGYDVNLQLVPYGRANSTKVGTNITFSCEHGEEECKSNKFHACAIDQGQWNDETVLNMVTCMLDRFSWDSIEKRVKVCCTQSNDFYNYDVLRVCATGNHGAQLLYENGLVTSRWNPFFMPTILLNGDAGDDEFQKELKGNLFATVLKYIKAAASTKSTPSANSTTGNKTEKAHLYKWDQQTLDAKTPKNMGQKLLVYHILLVLATFSAVQ